MYHSNRLRTGRHSQRGNLYLLTTTTCDRHPVFRDVVLGRSVVAEFKAAQMDRWVHSLAWVVMPDHFHWLIELGDSSLEELMRRVKTNSARAINRRRRTSGSLWQTGYHDLALRREEDVRAVARYVVANPLRAGLVDRLGDYPLWDAIWL
ncbi:REP-associated tyrosine transposase [Stutzerimonas xanthomarina]|uniref:REP element-mobilizing transposase RayT n=2 Tax=Stutzerimonas xanthomarina TaxID=271420 RepID=A0A1M5TH35_9GAMM|nr:transposase [Stutzerimonas xanthomarina]MCP9340832.1 transposase [Stutzerimonas xanthomarina]SEH54449.1 REP element-mobilizing transposase RayT [Stutzerimonas xanthomarina]SHH49663.1 REP element-mobilizing transposase RayT [Stutzerimonas xanthomarina DSM 18231]